VDTVLLDLRRAIRGFRRAPSLHLVAIVTIAIGIGVNTTMFSIVNAVLLRPLGYERPDELVALQSDMPGLGLANAGFSVQEVEDLNAAKHIFEMVAPTWLIDGNVTGGERPERVVALATTTEYFQLLGVAPQHGRLIGDSDRAAGFSEAAVLSHAAWQRMFGGDAAVVGKKIRLDSDLYTIVGVMPPGFRHPAPASMPDIDFWLAAGFRANPFPTEPSRRRRMLPGAVARLSHNVSLDQGSSALDTLAAAWRRDHAGDYPENAQYKLRLTPLREIVVGRTDKILFAVSGAVMLILLIGCANVANLMLAGSMAREGEMSIRQALGAERWQLTRQLLLEHLVLALVGGAAGVFAAEWTQALVLSAMPPGLPRIHEVGIDGRVVLFSLTITAIASVLFGIAPALLASKAPPLIALTEKGRGNTGSTRQGLLRTSLVVAEIALALTLVTGAGLLLRTVNGLVSVDTGFNADHVLVGRTWIAVPNNPELDRYRTAPARAALARGILDRLRERPEVSAAAVTTVLPLSGTVGKVPVQIEGKPNDGDIRSAGLSIVTPDYFSILGIPLVKGRLFAEDDDANRQAVAVIDETMVQKFFGNEDPIGQRLQVGRPGTDVPTVTVVGVARSAKYETLDAPQAPHIYLSLYQRSGRSISFVMKTRVAPAGLHDAVQSAVQRVDPDLPVFGVQSLEERVDASIVQQRFSAQAVTWFAVLALVLSAIGVYGVMAYSVTARTQEIGVRMAMGATPATMSAAILKDSLRATLIGVALGLALSTATLRSIRGMLFEVGPFDPVVFASAAGILIAVAVVASYWPARRAAKVDPVVSLRRV
jgi:predicted permease